MFVSGWIIAIVYIVAILSLCVIIKLSLLDGLGYKSNSLSASTCFDNISKVDLKELEKIAVAADTVVKKGIDRYRQLLRKNPPRN
jgi:hypothetical protein